MKHTRVIITLDFGGEYEWTPVAVFNFIVNQIRRWAAPCNIVGVEVKAEDWRA